MLDSCCISIGLVFIKDRPVSSFWVLRFRSRVLRFRVLGTSFSRFRGLRFRVMGASFSIQGASFSSFGCFVFEVWVLRSSFSSASFSKLPTNVLFSSVIPASGTRQIDKTFIKGLLTIQDQEHFKTHNKRKLRQQYRKSRFSGDKTTPLAVSFHHPRAAILDVFENFRSRPESRS